MENIQVSGQYPGPNGVWRSPGCADDKGVRPKWIRNINGKDFVPHNNSVLGTG